MRFVISQQQWLQQAEEEEEEEETTLPLAFCISVRSWALWVSWSLLVPNGFCSVSVQGEVCVCACAWREGSCSYVEAMDFYLAVS